MTDKERLDRLDEAARAIDHIRALGPPIESPYEGREADWRMCCDRCRAQVLALQLRARASASAGWIEWHGGECPVPVGESFEYRLRNGTGNGPLRTPTAWNWEHHGDQYDIVAYRLTEAAQAPPGASVMERAQAACAPLLYQRACTGDNVEDPGLILWRRDYDRLLENNARAIEQAEAEARAKAIEDAAQIAFDTANEDLPEQHWDLARERRQLWASACGRIMTKVRAL